MYPDAPLLCSACPVPSRDEWGCNYLGSTHQAADWRGRRVYREAVGARESTWRYATDLLELLRETAQAQPQAAPWLRVPRAAAAGLGMRESPTTLFTNSEMDT